MLKPVAAAVIALGALLAGCQSTAPPPSSPTASQPDGAFDETGAQRLLGRLGAVLLAADWPGYAAITTERFRSENYPNESDLRAWASVAQDLGVRDFDIEITAIDEVDGGYEISAVQSWTQDDGTRPSQALVLRAVLDGGAWKLDASRPA